jgi:hypothetical protein
VEAAILATVAEFHVAAEPVRAEEVVS